MISGLWLHEYRILRHKSKSKLKHLLLQWPLLHLVERWHPPTERVGDEVVQGFVF